MPPAVRWSLLLFILAIPLEGIDLGLGELSEIVSVARIAALPFFIACLFAPSVCFRRPPAPVLWFCAYLGILGIRGLSTPGDLRGQALTSFLTLVQLVLFCWISSNLFRDRVLAGQALRCYALAATLLAVGTLADIPGLAAAVETRESAVAARVTAVGYSTNELAAIAAVGAIVLLGEVLTGRLKPGRSLLAVTAALPLVVVVIRTASRAGVAALLVGLSVFLMPASGSRRRGVAVLLGAAIMLGVVFLVATNPLLEARIGASYRYGDTAGHTRIYDAAVDMVWERPIAGWGPAVGLNELGARLQYRRGARDAHNLLLHLLLDVGLIGCIPFLVGLWLVVKATWRARRTTLGLVPLALMAVILTVNIAHTFLARKPMWLVLAVGMASGTRANLMGRIRRRNGPEDYAGGHPNATAQKAQRA